MLAQQGTKFVLGIRTPSGKSVKAFDVCIKGEDVYVNYSDCSTPEMHKSYHASGQQHVKMSKQYVKWTGGPTGQWEPMKLFHTPPGLVSGRSDCFTAGWEISKLDQILPPLQESDDLMVDVQNPGTALVLCFQVSVIGPEAMNLKSILGFPIVATQQFGSSTRVEINAFTMAPEDLESESALSSTGAI